MQDADRNWPRVRRRGRGGRGAISRIHPNVGESEKKRDARRERWGRVCGRDWPWHTRSRYAYISPRSCHKTFHARRSVTPMITLPAIIIHASRANKFSRDGDDKNYYRPSWSPSDFACSTSVHTFAVLWQKRRKKKVIASSITVDIGKLRTGFVSQIIDRDGRGKVLPWEIARPVIDIRGYDFNVILTVA